MKIRIRVKPGKHKNKLTLLEDGTIECSVAAPAKEGHANKELKSYLSEIFSVPKSQVLILKGENSPYKQIELPLSQIQITAILRDL